MLRLSDLLNSCLRLVTLVVFRTWACQETCGVRLAPTSRDMTPDNPVTSSCSHATPGDDEVAAQEINEMHESRIGAIKPGIKGTPARHTCCGESSAERRGQMAPAAVPGSELMAEGNAAACQAQLLDTVLGTDSPHVAAAVQDAPGVSPCEAAQGGGRAGLAAAAHGEKMVAQGTPAMAQGGGIAGGLAAAYGEDTVAQAPPAAYESRLAAVDHGVEGAGGWCVGAACLPGQPIKADLTGPTLLEWVGDDMLLVTLPSGNLTVLRMDGAFLVRSPTKTSGFHCDLTGTTSLLICAGHLRIELD